MSSSIYNMVQALMEQQFLQNRTAKYLVISKTIYTALHKEISDLVDTGELVAINFHGARLELIILDRDDEYLLVG